MGKVHVEVVRCCRGDMWPGSVGVQIPRKFSAGANGPGPRWKEHRSRVVVEWLGTLTRGGFEIGGKGDDDVGIYM